ncbi:DgyrCDS13168 [Dimorphilus gyrociliatus]|uniref:DgyrCDS13168 n=1 Tax=Dimorphilus gyrociliatus TaxID=2664684 RepID=A0A7I8WA01_9ANNE|nr:DgyrCDS13168 [Dimorphilus gyrociliatus]
MYSYVTVGEFVAFLIGWNLILEYMIGTAAGASALSACFDSLGNHTMSESLEANVGTEVSESRPIGLVHADKQNWSNFSPYGPSGVFSGAATCFYAFIGFDIIATTGEEAKEASKSIPKAIISSLLISLTVYAAISIVLTLMLPYNEIHTDSALMDVWDQIGAPPGIKYVVAVGSIAALTVSLLGSMFPMPRVIYAMARDGLLFNFLSVVNKNTGTPLVATVITGFIASLLSLLVGLQVLVEMMSIGTLLAYTLVSVSVLILRYQPDAHDLEKTKTVIKRLDPIREVTPPVTPASDASSEIEQPSRLLDEIEPPKSYGAILEKLPFDTEKLQNGVVWFETKTKNVLLQFGFPDDETVATEKTARTVIFLVGCLSVVQFSACLLIVLGADGLASGQAMLVILLIIFIFAMIIFLVLIMKQPQNKRKLDFMAPMVPILPAAAMFFNIYLMLKLPPLTWARLGVWLVIGVAIYFGYGMWNSVKEKKDNERAEEMKENHQPTHFDPEIANKDQTRMVMNDPWTPSNDVQNGEYIPPLQPVKADFQHITNYQ